MPFTKGHPPYLYNHTPKIKKKMSDSRKVYIREIGGMPKGRDAAHWVDGRSKSPTYYKDKAREYRKAAIDILGGVCKRCGFSDTRALQIDHIHGGGHEERKNLKRLFHKHVIESILNNEDKYQLLCANCNCIKKVENGELKGYQKK